MPRRRCSKYEDYEDDSMYIYCMHCREKTGTENVKCFMAKDGYIMNCGNCVECGNCKAKYANKEDCFEAYEARNRLREGIPPCGSNRLSKRNLRGRGRLKYPGSTKPKFRERKSRSPCLRPQFDESDGIARDRSRSVIRKFTPRASRAGKLPSRYDGDSSVGRARYRSDTKRYRDSSVGKARNRRAPVINFYSREESGRTRGISLMRDRASSPFSITGRPSPASQRPGRYPISAEEERFTSTKFSASRMASPSRGGSRPPSRVGSRPPSRVGSRPPSRVGSKVGSRPTSGLEYRPPSGMASRRSSGVMESRRTSRATSRAVTPHFEEFAERQPVQTLEAHDMESDEQEEAGCFSSLIQCLTCKTKSPVKKQNVYAVARADSPLSQMGDTEEPRLVIRCNNCGAIKTHFSKDEKRALLELSRHWEL